MSFLIRKFPITSSYKICSRSISTTKCSFVKKIEINETENEIVIKAVPIESDRKKNLIHLPPNQHQNCSSCPLCRLNLKGLKYSDVLILNQFIESNGTLMPQNVTGLCTRSYRKVKKLVQQAQSARLLPRPPTYECYGEWDNLNRYYEYPKRNRDRPLNIVRPEYWEN